MRPCFKPVCFSWLFLKKKNAIDCKKTIWYLDNQFIGGGVSVGAGIVDKMSRVVICSVWLFCMIPERLHWYSCLCLYVYIYRYIQCTRGIIRCSILLYATCVVHKMQTKLQQHKGFIFSNIILEITPVWYWSLVWLLMVNIMMNIYSTLCFVKDLHNKSKWMQSNNWIYAVVPLLCGFSDGKPSPLQRPFRKTQYKSTCTNRPPLLCCLNLSWCLICV